MSNNSAARVESYGNGRIHRVEQADHRTAERQELNAQVHRLLMRERELEARLADTRRRLRAAEERNALALVKADEDIELLRDVVADVMSSPSWRLTAPLRAGKRLALRSIRDRHKQS